MVTVTMETLYVNLYVTDIDTTMSITVLYKSSKFESNTLQNVANILDWTRSDYVVKYDHFKLAQ